MSAKLLVFGSGAREQCIAWKLAQSSEVKVVYLIPGNAGSELLGSHKIRCPSNPPFISSFASLAQWCITEEIALVVVGPEAPLVDGIADVLEAKGVQCFGPHANAAVVEGSKLFAKEFMSRFSIPTARYQCFTDVESACKHIRSAPYRATVVKASGLAAGKGVVVAGNRDEACVAANTILKEKTFGDAGSQIVIEECLEGEEVSVLCFCDGKNIAVMPPAQDHKRLLNGDAGPNTGGMGAYCPCPQISERILTYIKTEILQKVIDGFREEGRPYVGVLYAGLMLTKDGPKVLEFNCRFGDPECQVILPLLQTDLYQIMRACVRKKLDTVLVRWKAASSSVAVVLASGGYPKSYQKGKKITGLHSTQRSDNVLIFHAGTKIDQNMDIVTSGGRVLTVVGHGDSLQSSLSLALERILSIHFEACYHRTDIAWRGLDYENRKRLTYADSGVSISNGDEFVKQISPLAKSTCRDGCVGSIGGFGGMFDVESAGYAKPVLVAGTDGVGTKLMIADAMCNHATIGIDLVAMCVNDILTHNAEPLFFLDYYACGKLSPRVACEVVKGIAVGCRVAGCALIGGETAEMPGMYERGSYDLAGFAVGAYDKEKHIPLPRINDVIEGDVVIGVESAGLHSNGFSLVRKILEKSSLCLADAFPFDETKSLGECLLTPTAIYCKQLLPVLRSNVGIRALAHITGGGIIGNLPRVLPDHLGVRLDARCWKINPVFGWLCKEGDVEGGEMLRTYNCGLGMCMIVSSQCTDHVLSQCNDALASSNLSAFKVGKVLPRKSLIERVVVENVEEAFNAVSEKICEKTPINNDLNVECKEDVGKKRVAVIISGTGTNLQALIDHSLTESDCPYQIRLVISNKDKAYGLTRAKEHGVAAKVINSKLFSDRESFDQAVHEELLRHKIDIVCLAGFMRLLSAWFVQKWRGRLLNIHPSLLPLFKGMNPHKQALDAGVCVSGCSVHFVVEEMDAGAIVGQKTVPVHPSDTVEMLKDRIKESEHELYPLVLDQVCREEVLFYAAENRVVWQNLKFKAQATD